MRSWLRLFLFFVTIGFIYFIYSMNARKSKLVWQNHQSVVFTSTAAYRLQKDYFEQHSTYALTRNALLDGHEPIHTTADINILSSSKNTFLIEVSLNLDNDPQVERWTIDQNKVLRHIFCDINNEFSN